MVLLPEYLRTRPMDHLHLDLHQVDLGEVGESLLVLVGDHPSLLENEGGKLPIELRPHLGRICQGTFESTNYESSKL